MTGLSVTSSILLIGMICTLYTSLGGIKAVIWTDVVQVVLMFAGLIVVMLRVSLIGRLHFLDCFFYIDVYFALIFFRLSIWLVALRKPLYVQLVMIVYSFSTGRLIFTRPPLFGIVSLAWARCGVVTMLQAKRKFRDIAMLPLRRKQRCRRLCVLI